MFCQKCGAKLDPEASFCDQCGGRVGAPAPAPVVGGAQPKPAPVPTPRALPVPERTPAKPPMTPMPAGRPSTSGVPSPALLILMGILGFVLLAGAGWYVFSRIARGPASPTPTAPAATTPPAPATSTPAAPPVLSAPTAAPPTASSTSSPVATTTPTSATPEECLAEYYRLIDADRYREAYALRSQRSRNKTSYAEFEKTWSNNHAVRLESFELVAQKPDRVQARVRLVAEDEGSPLTPYVGLVKMASENGRWRYDGGDFTPVQGPEEVVKSFYQWHVAHWSDYRGRFSEQRARFSPELYEGLEEAFRKGPSDGAWLDVNPFSASQMGVAGFETNLRQGDDREAVVDISVESTRGGRTQVAMTVGNLGGRWVITDVWADGRSLRETLREINGH